MEQPRLPKLVSLAKASIVKFKKDFLEYVRDCETINRSRAEGSKVTIKKWSECIDNELKEVIPTEPFPEREFEEK